MHFVTFKILLYSEKICLSNHLICHLDNNKDFETKYLNDLLSNFSTKKRQGHTLDRLQHTVAFGFCTYV